MDSETNKQVFHCIQVKYKGKQIINFLIVTQFMTLSLILTTNPAQHIKRTQ
jgi:hypothetical protein